MFSLDAMPVFMLSRQDLRLLNRQHIHSSELPPRAVHSAHHCISLSEASLTSGQQHASGRADASVWS